MPTIVLCSESKESVPDYSTTCFNCDFFVLLNKLIYYYLFKKKILSEMREIS